MSPNSYIPLGTAFIESKAVPSQRLVLVSDGGRFVYFEVDDKGNLGNRLPNQSNVNLTVCERQKELERAYQPTRFRVWIGNDKEKAWEIAERESSG